MTLTSTLDPKEIADLFERSKRRLFSIARGIGLNDLKEDLYQMVFCNVVATNNLRRDEDPTVQFAYIKKSFLSECLKELKRRKRNKPPRNFNEEMHSNDCVYNERHTRSPLKILTKREEDTYHKEMVAASIEELPSREREIFVGNFFNKTPYMDLGERIGISKGYAKLIGFKAKNKVIAAVREKAGSLDCSKKVPKEFWRSNASSYRGAVLELPRRSLVATLGIDVYEPSPGIKQEKKM